MNHTRSGRSPGLLAGLALPGDRERVVAALRPVLPFPSSGFSVQPTEVKFVSDHMARAVLVSLRSGGARPATCAPRPTIPSPKRPLINSGQETPGPPRYRQRGVSGAMVLEAAPSRGPWRSPRPLTLSRGGG